MARKQAQVPFDHPTLAEWRITLGLHVGETYASMSTNEATEFDRMVNEAMEYVSKRFAHEPWMLEETTLSITSGNDTTYSMPAAFRHVVVITEEATTTTFRARASTKADFLNAWSTGATTEHPWKPQPTSTWFFDSMTDDVPPVQQWRRIGQDAAGNTARVLFRPYFGALAASGQDQYPVMPPSAMAAVKNKFAHAWSIFKKRFEEAAVYKQDLEDEIATQQINDLDTHEDPYRQGLDPAFLREVT